MKCLVTGINGFAGSYLAEHLHEHANNICGTVYPGDFTQNIEHILNRIETIPCDLNNPSEIVKIVEKTKPDRIFHLAAQGFIPASWSDPIGTFQINVMGTLHLLESIKKHSPGAKVLIISSAEVYGNINSDKPIAETAPLKPQNPYAVTKTCTDLLSGQLAEFYKLNIIRIRPFNHIGPRQSPKYVVSDFSRQIALIEKGKKKPVIKVGNLESKLDFTDVRDMVRAYWLAIEKCRSGEAYNISSGKTYSIEEILKKLLSLAKTKIKVEPDPLKFRIQNISMKLGNSQKFRSQTGWKPEIPLEETLKETLNWWRQTLINTDIDTDIH